MVLGRLVIISAIAFGCIVLGFVIIAATRWVIG
jgi:hypothetical protein